MCYTFVCYELYQSMSEQSNANHRGHLGENSHDRIEMHESYTESCRKKYKDESGEQWEGASKSF